MPSIEADAVPCAIHANLPELSLSSGSYTTLLKDDDAGSLHNLPSSESVSRFMFNESIQNVMQSLSHNHNECLNYLLSLRSPYDDLEPSALMQSIVENIFIGILSFNSLHKAFYATLLIEIFSVEASSHRFTASVVTSLVENIQILQPQSIRYLSQWFAFHLSNFDYIWKWGSWTELMQQPEIANFVGESLKQAVRLGYHARVLASLPAGFAPEFISATAPAPSFTHKDDKDALKLSTSFRLGAIGSDDIDLNLQCILYAGSKSFTHLINVLQKNENYMASLVTNKPREVLAVMGMFYEHQEQYLEFSIGKFLEMGYLSANAIVLWCIEQIQENPSVFCYVTILENTIKTQLRKSTENTEFFKALLSKFKEVFLLRLESKSADEIGFKYVFGWFACIVRSVLYILLLD